MNKLVYMDYHATTPVDREVLDAMMPYFSEKFGNAASRQHPFGWEADAAVEASRASVSRLIGANPKEIVFTGGATESNNLAIKGIAEALKGKGNRIITVQTEHKSVLDSCKRLQKYGLDIILLPVDDNGRISLDELESAINSSTILVSVMMANNEIGTIQQMDEIGKICRKKEVYFHTDATQAIGKIPIDVQTSYIDLLSLSSHKFYGPKGTGALYVRNSNPKVKLTLQMDGGGHERGMRSGTLNVPGIVGLGKACEVAGRVLPTEAKRVKSLRDKMYEEISKAIPGVYLNGDPVNRLPNNLNLCFSGVEDSVLMLSMKEIAISTGSACSTGDPEPSHVLKAMKAVPNRLGSSIRFGLGRYTTVEEVDYVIGRVIESVTKLRELSGVQHVK